jgi:nucleotide-binding universal stress UspA family protein
MTNRRAAVQRVRERLDSEIRERPPREELDHVRANPVRGPQRPARPAAATVVADEAGVRSRTVVGAGVDDADCIFDEVRQRRCGLIVVGSMGRNAVLRLLTGSVIPGLITVSTIPVLIVRERGGIEGSQERCGGADAARSASRAGPSGTGWAGQDSISGDRRLPTPAAGGRRRIVRAQIRSSYGQARFVGSGSISEIAERVLAAIHTNAGNNLRVAFAATGA